MSFFKSPSGITWTTETPLTQDQINNELVDAGVNLCGSDVWNTGIQENTIADDQNDLETADDYRTALPKSITPYDGLEVKGQGIHSSCFAAAMVGVAEDQYHQATGQIKRFAIFPFYMLGQMETPGLYGEDGGTVPPHGIKAATKIGFLSEDTARKYLPPALVRKWKGDVYPRGYWTGRGNFEATAQQAYIEACRAYEPILKRDDVREEMHNHRLKTIIPAKQPEHIVESLRAQSGTNLSCHVWTPDCDSHPTQIQTFSGRSRGGQHGHHATYEAWLSPNGMPIKANSWREFRLLMMAEQAGTQDLDAKEWGDDGLKTWAWNAFVQQFQHPHSFNYICSNMSVASSPKVRKPDIGNRRLYT